MREIKVEPAFAEKLDKLTGQTILSDTQGRALGFFSPLHDHPQVQDMQLEPPLSIAETEELRKVRAGKPLNEILGRLGL